MKVLSGLVLIDKPTGITSFDVIRKLRQRFAELGYFKVKMGHAGTLDPAASGLLLVAIGSATKALHHLLAEDKTYEAGILLGEATDTLDSEGVVTAWADASHLKQDDILVGVGSLGGCHELPVPLYSAIKVDGKPLYAYARAGQTPPRIPVKTMCVRDITLTKVRRGPTPTDASGGQAPRRTPGTISGTVLVECLLSVSKGTYIRSLAEELGRRLGVPARLETLRRTQIGPYFLENAKPPREITESDICPL